MPTALPTFANPVDAGLYRGIWRYAAGARVAMLASMALLMGSQLVRLAVPWFAAQAIDALQNGGPGSLARALAWVGCAMGASVGSWMLHGPGRVLERRVGMRVRESLSDELYARVTAAPLGWHERHDSNDMQQRVRQSTQALHEFSANQFIYLQSLVGLVGPLVALAVLSPGIGLAAFLAFGALALVSMRIDRTLMKLAMQDGEVPTGVHNLASLSTLIPQEADVFEGAVRENLDFGTALPPNPLAAAMRGSAFDAVLSGLDGGLEFAVAERGSNLSGGQRQRLCLARGALAAADSSIVFLDEPTGALDPITEVRIHHALDATFPSACIVESVHRMSLLAHVDSVAWREGGRLVDIGSLAQLRERQPAFEHMLAGSAHETATPVDDPGRLIRTAAAPLRHAHAGVDTLRSKSLDKNSDDSGVVGDLDAG